MANEAMQLSGLQHFAYCPRQWALIHLEQQWRENERTADGRIFHGNAHDGLSHELRGDVLILRGLRVFSDRLDLEEELRAPIADRLVLTLINNRSIQDRHFEKQGSGGIFLSEDGRRLFLKHWQERKRDEITHPFLKEKMPWGLVPYVQALLLARHIRGDLDGYPPLMWK